MAFGLAVWFILTLLVWIAVLERWVIESLSAWIPDSILHFAQMNVEGDLPSAGVIVTLLLIAFVLKRPGRPCDRGAVLSRLSPSAYRSFWPLGSDY